MYCEYYCFIHEDLYNLKESHYLRIQYEYAQRIGRALICHIRNRTVKRTDGIDADIKGKTIRISSSIKYFYECMSIIKSHGAYSVETLDDISKIQQWYRKYKINRRITSISRRDLISGRLTKDTIEIIRNSNPVFMKSENKGFSATVENYRLLHADTDLVKSLDDMGVGDDDVLIISEYMDILYDSLGKKEVRFFIENKRICNASRYILNGLSHNVSSKFFKRAEELISLIPDGFPDSFVMDLAEYCVSNENYIDIVEINPISVSTVYVNNSIFSEMINTIETYFIDKRFGYEWCLYGLEHPEFFVKERDGSKRYCVNDALIQLSNINSRK